MSHLVCLAWSVMGSANTLLFSWINGFNLNTHKPQMNATNQCREGDMWKANVELHKPMYAWETMKNRGKFREPKEPWSMPSSQPSPKMSQLFNTCFQDMSNYMIHPWQCIYIYIIHHHIRKLWTTSTTPDGPGLVWLRVTSGDAAHDLYLASLSVTPSVLITT